MEKNFLIRKRDILKTLIAYSNWLTVYKANYMYIIILVQQLMAAKVSMI